jgi:hypothetical protein
MQIFLFFEEVRIGGVDFVGDLCGIFAYISVYYMVCCGESAAVANR